MTIRKERRKEREENNGGGLVAVQQPDGSIQHISREEWGGSEDGDEPASE